MDRVLGLLAALCGMLVCAAVFPRVAVNRRMDEWVLGGEMDLGTVELEVETVGPDGK